MTPWSQTPRWEGHRGVKKTKYFFETEFKNIVACLSGAQMDSNHENLVTHFLLHDATERKTFVFIIYCISF